MASKVVAKKVGRRSFLKTVSGLSIATAGIFLAIVSPGCTDNSDSDSDSGDQSSRSAANSDSSDQSGRSATDSDSSDQSDRSASDSDSSDQSGR